MLGGMPVKTRPHAGLQSSALLTSVELNCQSWICRSFFSGQLSRSVSQQLLMKGQSAVQHCGHAQQHFDSVQVRRREILTLVGQVTDVPRVTTTLTSLAGFRPRGPMEAPDDEALDPDNPLEEAESPPDSPRSPVISHTRDASFAPPASSPQHSSAPHENIAHSSIADSVRRRETAELEQVSGASAKQQDGALEQQVEGSSSSVPCEPSSSPGKQQENVDSSSSNSSVQQQPHKGKSSMRPSAGKNELVTGQASDGMRVDEGEVPAEKVQDAPQPSLPASEEPESGKGTRNQPGALVVGA